ncbi:MAG TPA: RNA polymerase sigma factor [Ktedonobacterales bacterium]|nr:RNA polymerase sigma factor [Ktedonobacterales bacterium]
MTRGDKRVEENELSAALAANREGAYECVVRTFQHRLYAFALRMCGSPQDAEEIAQDAFIRAYRALRTYPAERVRALALRPWLYQITLNVYRNRTRSVRLRTVPLDGPEDSAPLEIEDDARERPDAAAERAELRDTMAAALLRLPAHFRAAVILRHVEGLSYQEIAALLGQPQGTVKAHVHRGAKLLREALAATLKLAEV